MVTGFLNGACIFKLYFKFSHAAVLQTMFCFACNLQDSAGNISMLQTALYLDKYTFFSYIQNLSSVIREVYKGKGIVSWNRVANVHIIILLSAFCFSSKRYQIPFCSMQTGRRFLKFCLPTYFIWYSGTTVTQK